MLCVAKPRARGTFSLKQKFALRQVWVVPASTLSDVRLSGIILLAAKLLCLSSTYKTTMIEMQSLSFVEWLCLQ